MTYCVFAVRMNEPASNTERIWIDRWMDYVPKSRQIRIERFWQWQDQWRALAGELLVRSVLRTHYGIPHESLIFLRDKYGKPSLSGNEVSFNLSHAGIWAVAAFHSEPIGIDIEQIGEADMEIAKMMFKKEEFDFLCALPEHLRRHRFYDIWTGKESYMKGVGKGLQIPLDSFSVHVDETNRVTLSGGEQESSWHLNKYDLDPNYSLTVCAKSAEFPHQVIQLEAAQLTESLVLFD